MLAMKRFVTLVDRDDFFNTTNKPKELPNKAIMKITAYAVVMPILILSETMPLNGAGGAPVEFVPKREIENVHCFIFKMKGSLTVSPSTVLENNSKS